MHRVNEHHQIMAKEFQQDFVDLAGLGLRPDGISELPFYHRKNSFGLGTLMVSAQESRLVQDEVGVELSPQRRSLACGVGLERDVGVCPVLDDMPQVSIGHVRLIGADLGNTREAFGCTIQQDGQHGHDPYLFAIGKGLRAVSEIPQGLVGTKSRLLNRGMTCPT